jgi:hypothetical protein
VTGRADRWIRRTTIGCVALLALIAATVSYLHMHELVASHGQQGWVALTPLSVDGMIVAASTTLLSESRSGSRGGMLPWTLLAVGSIASLGANMAVAQSTVTGRLIAAWPSFALIGSYELLMRQVRATAGRALRSAASAEHRWRQATVATSSGSGPRTAGRDLQWQAWQWADANRAADGSLPSGRAIAAQFGRHERWGRLIKRKGSAGDFAESAPRCLCKVRRESWPALD